MPVLKLELRSDSDLRDTVKVEHLTPLARALAECIEPHPLRSLATIWLQTLHPLGVLVPADEVHFWYRESFDKPHRIPWSTWTDYPTNSANPPAAYLEQQARRLPIGYHPVGADLGDPKPVAWRDVGLDGKGRSGL